MGSNTSRTWEELRGETKWAGMLDPLDNDLRMYVIHYGERVQAIGDAFNNDDVSPACNFSRFPMKHFFSYVGLEINNPFKYEVKRFVYTKNLVFVGETTWIGYVAVSTDEVAKQQGKRDILVAWRGTVRPNEVLADIDDGQVQAKEIFGTDAEIKIHAGWHLMYNNTTTIIPDEYTRTTAREQVLEEIENQMKAYSEETVSITVVGHSMGAALATINATDIVMNGKNKVSGGNPCPVTVFAFSSPMVGNEGFKNKVEGLENLYILRTENVLDIVPHLPPVGYYHVGQTLQVDSRDSPDIKFFDKGVTLGDILGMAHQLEVLLHLVAGTKGLRNGFDLAGPRDPALVNKGGDYLKEEVAKEKGVPASWWVVKNKGMVQKANDGSWVLDDYKPDP